uniref:F-box domain-containing protein n=1 Tax=Aegilops tauschii subsp. strangulata TaxID=200361 RepID=A0A453MXT4_AEGTS
VCRRWRRLVCDPVFFRRFCLHNRRSPPMLGFFVGRRPLCFSPTLEVPNRVPRSASSSTTAATTTKSSIAAMASS